MIWAVDEKGYRLTRKLADEEHALITTHVAETNVRTGDGRVALRTERTRNF